MALAFNPADHSYTYLGAPVPSVTQVLKDLRVAPPYPEDRGWLKFGKQVHHACELVLHDRIWIADSASDPYPGTSALLWPYLDAFRDFVRQYQVTPLHTELPVYNDFQGYAGTLDLHCRMFGRDEAIVDYKTGAPPKCTRLQTAAYDLALNRTLGLPERHRPRRRFALHLFEGEVKQAGRAKVQEFTDLADYDYWTGWMWAWKWQHGGCA